MADQKLVNPCIIEKTDYEIYGRQPLSIAVFYTDLNLFILKS